MTEIPVCQPPVRETRRSTMATPTGATDCHTHVFESRFPMIPHRGYTPPDSNLADMLAMHGQIGIERVVFTQPSIYGIDNTAILSAMDQIPHKARAVVAIDLSLSDEELVALDRRGVRGVRLNLDNVGGMPVELDEIPTLAGRIAELDWHIEFLFAGQHFPELLPMLRSVQVPISIGHFGYMPAAEGVSYPPFRALVDLIKEGNTWMKLSGPNRLGVGDLPPWDAVAPLAHALIEANPERMLWATDWPHPNKFGNMPNDADLIEQLALWAPDPALRKRILVDNPANLYRF
jgi:predicted TIM-barrel fold metal-dependent hydrolase